MMHQVDKDGSGTIDFEEFCALMAPKLLVDDGKEELQQSLSALRFSARLPPPSVGWHRSISSGLAHVLSKDKSGHGSLGVGGKRGWPWLRSILVSGLLGFLGVLGPALIHWPITDESDYTLILGSFGASAVLLYGAPFSPLAQPRNVFLGHLLCAVIGVATYKACGEPVLGSNLVAAPLSVCFGIMAMQIFDCLHPPGGGTVIIAGDESCI